MTLHGTHCSRCASHAPRGSTRGKGCVRVSATYKVLEDVRHESFVNDEPLVFTYKAGASVTPADASEQAALDTLVSIGLAEVAGKAKTKGGESS